MKISKWLRFAWLACVLCSLVHPAQSAEYRSLQEPASPSDQPAPYTVRASIGDGLPSYEMPSCSAPSCGYPSCSAPACDGGWVSSGPYADPYGHNGGYNYGGNDCPPALTVRAEYLMWWTRGRPVPPLVTTSPQGTDRDIAGVLGFDTTEILFGDENLGNDMRSGGRVSLSHLCNPCSETYLDVRFWGLENGNERFFKRSDGDPILARPFFNVTEQREDAFRVAFPDLVTDASILVNSDNDLYGADAMLRCLWCASGCSEFYLLGGYQFTALDDTLFIRNVQTSIDPDSAFIPGTVIDVQDEFSAQNRLHAGSLGMLWVSYGCRHDLEVLGKVAFGNVQQRVVIDGRNIVTPPDEGTPELTEGGLLAQPTNIGEYDRNEFAIIPEINVNLRYHIHCGCDLIFGYSMIYWDEVVLAGDQIDRDEDTLGPPVGEGFPEFNFRGNDFWAQGMNIGLECWW